MTLILKPRQYQEDALAALEEGWTTTTENRLAVVLPTGMGKTVIFSHLVDREAKAGRRTLILVHRDELVKQAASKIKSVSPDLTVGVIKASRNETDADVVIASVQTLSRPSRLSQIHQGNFGCVIVDECHHAVAKSYVTILEWFGGMRGFNPEIPRPRVAGFTATMARGDSRGLGDVWQRVVYTRDLSYGIMHGFLTDVVGKSVTVDGLDLGSVARSRGDYQEGALGDALIESGAGEIIASAYIEHAGKRQGVVFAPNVASAMAITNDFNDAGIVSELVVGTTLTEDRDLIFKRYEVGETQVLVNCMVLTEGWDAPHAEVAVIARPTTSASLYIQMVGRVLRPFPGKKDALVLDVVGVAGRHKLASLIDLTETGVSPQEGESLAEAIEREANEALERDAADPMAKIVGKVHLSDVDLFHNSTSMWLQTPGGHWFIPTKAHTFFIWPEPAGTFRVGRCDVYSNQNGTWLHEGVELGYAMAWTERYAEESDPTVASKSASWRKRRQKPSDAQTGLASRLKVPFDDSTSKGELSDLISVHYASRILDPKVRNR